MSHRSPHDRLQTGSGGEAGDDSDTSHIPPVPPLPKPRPPSSGFIDEDDNRTFPIDYQPKIPAKTPSTQLGRVPAPLDNTRPKGPTTKWGSWNLKSSGNNTPRGNNTSIGLPQTPGLQSAIAESSATTHSTSQVLGSRAETPAPLRSSERLSPPYYYTTPVTSSVPLPSSEPLNPPFYTTPVESSAPPPSFEPLSPPYYRSSSPDIHVESPPLLPAIPRHALDIPIPIPTLKPANPSDVYSPTPRRTPGAPYASQMNPVLGSVMTSSPRSMIRAGKGKELLLSLPEGHERAMPEEESKVQLPNFSGREHGKVSCLVNRVFDAFNLRILDSVLSAAHTFQASCSTAQPDVCFVFANC